MSFNFGDVNTQILYEENTTSWTLHKYSDTLS